MLEWKWEWEQQCKKMYWCWWWVIFGLANRENEGERESQWMSKRCMEIWLHCLTGFYMCSVGVTDCWLLTADCCLQNWLAKRRGHRTKLQKDCHHETVHCCLFFSFFFLSQKKKKRKMSTVKHICPQMGCREEKTVAVEDLESNKMKKKEKGRKGEREWIWEKYPQIPIVPTLFDWLCMRLDWLSNGLGNCHVMRVLLMIVSLVAAWI